jgi:prolyl-tRNA editing enzyme YbaK/EbsC (Cys-tRNA(Pro) deacylase)
MGVEVISHRGLFEQVFEQAQRTPQPGQVVKSRAEVVGYVLAMTAEDLTGKGPAPSEHPSIAHFRATLSSLGGTGRIVVLPDSVHTAALAAEALGCEVGAIANSLLFAAPRADEGDQPVLILTSGAHRVDVEKVAASVGVTSLRRAKPEFVKQHTGQVIGGVSPIAHPAPVRTYLDRDLAGYDVLWAAAGHPAAVFSTHYAELLALTGATEIEVE